MTPDPRGDVAFSTATKTAGELGTVRAPAEDSSVLAHLRAYDYALRRGRLLVDVVDPTAPLAMLPVVLHPSSTWFGMKRGTSPRYVFAGGHLVWVRWPLRLQN
jgi:hypothetical protein